MFWCKHCICTYIHTTRSDSTHWPTTCAFNESVHSSTKYSYSIWYSIGNMSYIHYYISSHGTQFGKWMWLHKELKTTTLLLRLGSLGQTWQCSVACWKSVNSASHWTGHSCASGQWESEWQNSVLYKSLNFHFVLELHTHMYILCHMAARVSR